MSAMVWRFKPVFVWVFVGLSLISANTFSQGVSGNIPGVISPGGQLPQLDDQSLPEQDPNVLSIPPVLARPLDIAEGPRIIVSSFDLNIDNLLAGFTPSALIDRVDTYLAQQLSAQGDTGYTIGQLEAVAQGVTDIFRAEGFVLSRAYLPVQDVQGGRVGLAVLAGWLDQVSYEGNRRYKVKRLDQPFADLLGKPVQLKQLESAVLKIRDYPGLSPTAVLGPGSSVGSSNLTLQLVEKQFGGGVSLDNYGSETSGRVRARGSFVWNNPLKRADSLFIDVLQTFDPAENTYGSIFYETPIFSPNFLTSLSITKNDFDIVNVGDINISAAKLSGDSLIGTWAGKYKLVRSRNFNLNFAGALALKEANFNDPFGKREDKLTVVSLGIEMDVIDNLLGALGINQLQLYGHVGLDDFLGSMDKDGNFNSTRQGGEFFQYAGGDFSKITINFQRLQRITDLNSLLLRGFYQFSDDMLVSLEQVSLGGAYSVRAYPVSNTLVDKGGFAAAEWLFDLTGMELFSSGVVDVTLFAFVDYGGGRLNDPLPTETEEKFDLSSYGAGFEVKFNIGGDGRVFFRLDIATPLGDRPIPDDDDPRAWGRLSVNF